jgi:hypothetical protein
MWDFLGNGLLSALLPLLWRSLRCAIGGVTDSRR